MASSASSSPPSLLSHLRSTRYHSSFISIISLISCQVDHFNSIHFIATLFPALQSISLRPCAVECLTTRIWANCRDDVKKWSNAKDRGSVHIKLQCPSMSPVLLNVFELTMSRSSFCPLFSTFHRSTRPTLLTPWNTIARTTYCRRSCDSVY